MGYGVSEQKSPLLTVVAQLHALAPPKARTGALREFFLRRKLVFFTFFLKECRQMYSL
tara:strand:- start:266 stop:439 length:174 start_codon:yes stop_codon:yes gene_type:complete